MTAPAARTPPAAARRSRRPTESQVQVFPSFLVRNGRGSSRMGAGMGARVARPSFSSLLERWPVVRQLRSHDALGHAENAASERSSTLTPHTSSADRVVASVCPYCAVGCGQRVYVRGEKII